MPFRIVAATGMLQKKDFHSRRAKAIVEIAPLIHLTWRVMVNRCKRSAATNGPF